MILARLTLALALFALSGMVIADQGIVEARRLTQDGDGKWINGTVYDPNTGKTYRCTVTLVNANTLKIRGYAGVSLFGRSETWTRDDPEPDSH